MPIRVITFDWGDTLAANYGMPYVETQRRAFRRLSAELQAAGCDGTGEAWERACIDEIEREWRRSGSPQLNPEHREIDMRAMFDRWLAAAGAHGADPHRVRLAVERCNEMMTDTVILFAEVLPALSLLKARGYRLGILSHVPWPGDACRAWFARHGLAPFLDFYSLSCEIGWIKPHPAHFQHALGLAGCRPEEILHVGDHPLRDIHGGREAGFRTCLRHTEQIHSADAIAACKPDAEIIRLREVLEVAKRF